MPKDSPRRMPGVGAVSVEYTNDRLIEIIQEDALGDESRIVFLLPAQIPQLVKWLEEAAEEAKAESGL